MLSGYPGVERHVGLLCSASSLHSWRETRPDLELKGQGETLSPDAPILKVVNDALVSSGPTSKHKEALSAVRKKILDDPDDLILPQDWVHWDAIRE